MGEYPLTGIRPPARLSLCLLVVISALGFLALLLQAGHASANAALGEFSITRATPPNAQRLMNPGAPPALHRLTHDGRSTPWTWTPDGELLVQRPGQIVGLQQLSELWLVSAQDGSERRLSENALHPTLHQGQLAYLRYQAPDEWQAIVADFESGTTLHARPTQWNAPPRWIDGQAWHFTRSGRWTSIEGQRSFPGLSLPVPSARTRLSPDGAHAATTDGRTLWVSGPNDTLVVARADQVHGFAWSADGMQLAYVLADDGPQPELGIWTRETGQVHRLLRGELEHFGEPAWSPDGQTLALVRSPTGSSTAGDIWLVDVDAPASARPLALTEADARAPCWSPDGRRLALALDGDLYIADLDASPQSPADLRSVAGGRGDDSFSRERPPSVPPVKPTGGMEPLGLDAPETILVLHDAQGNTCRNVPDGQIDAIPFEQYVKQVTPNEVPTGWPTEALKTQAVAARTYAWRKWLDQGTRPYTVKDSTADQYMCDTTYPNTDSAVDATQGQYVAYDGKVIYSFYSAEAGHLTNYRQLWPSIAYLRSVADPGGLGKTRHGHSWGMSQWGAYRWAQSHGWTYPQILAFYYTGATVEPSNTRVWPLAAVVWPQSNAYITRDTADLRALASSAKTVGADSGVLTVTLSARFTDTWTLIYTDTNAADGWGTLWPVHTLSDTLTPSIALRATAYDLVGWRQESELSYVGLNRSPPSGTITLDSTQITVSAQTMPTTVPTLTLTLVVTATDPSPTHLPLRVSLGTEDRVWEDHEFTTTVGMVVADTAAWDGSAWHVEPGEPGTLVSAASHRLSPGSSPGIYRAWVRLRVPTATLTMTHEIARLAALNADDELLGVRYLRGTDLKVGDAYQEFDVDLMAAEDDAVWWRIDALGTSALWVDRLSLASYPLELPALGTPLAWSLPPGDGVRTVMARYVDGAENVSSRAPLTVTVVDLDPPAGWRYFYCVERACRVEIRDAIAGLDTGSGAVRTSVDGGDSWSNWLPVTCTGELGSHDWETLYLPGIEPEAHNSDTLLDCDAQIQFRVRDMAEAPNEGLSPVYVYDSCYHSYLPYVADSAGSDLGGSQNARASR